MHGTNPNSDYDSPRPTWPRWLKLLLWLLLLVGGSSVAAIVGNFPVFVPAGVCLVALVSFLMISGSWRLAGWLWPERGPVIFRVVWLCIGYSALLWLLLSNDRLKELARSWPALCASMLALLWLGLLAVMLAPRWFFSRRGLTRILFGIACLATAVALFYTEENWRGRREWERFHRDWEAKGVKFDFAAVIPAAIPDEQNVAMHPLFRPIFNYEMSMRQVHWRDTNGMQRLQDMTPYAWYLRKPFTETPSLTSVQGRSNGVSLAKMTDWQRFYRGDTNFAATPKAPTAAEDVLLYLKRHDSSLAMLDEALARPGCRFQFALTENAPYPVLPHLQHLSMIARTISLRACARVEAGEADSALQDIERLWKLCGLLDREPFLVSRMVQIGMQANSLGPIAHGLAFHRWEDRHLRRLEEMLSPINKFDNYELCIRNEAAWMAWSSGYLRQNRAEAERSFREMSEHSIRTSGLSDRDRKVLSVAVGCFILRNAPAGWYDQVQVSVIGELLTGLNPSFVDPLHRRISWDSKPVLPSSPWFKRAWPLRWPERTAETIAARCARLQTGFDQTRIACALERYLLRHHAYPEQLATLVPEFLDRIPHDVFDGQPMHYRREGERGFVLWSIGFDGKDDDAAPLVGFDANGVEKGDLVWRYPAK
ncbi:MAG: hypothetical protein HY300_05885 [Verrucomicrobia bacterium]|nr:hypothetical protein [Verrucomicrobiota bacterium]